MIFIIAGVAISGDKPWFDMGCDLCKPFMEEPKLMETMGHEQYEISNGIVMVSTVEASLLPAYRTAHGKMMAEIDRVEKGDSLYMCGYCTTFGGLTEAGAKLEYVETKTGDITIMTGDKPELIADIKGMAQRTEEEMKKMEEMEKKEQTHD
jgi:phosphosulfolactate synthase (CoM biosynthesis protein A)